MNGSHKIAAQHLTRPAVVYVRQSTLDQVRHHHESRRRQYQLAERARGLGWKEVSVIDEDLGKSGASSLKRTGFQRLVAEVGLGRIGAVLSIEVSRLARNNRDWYHLLDLCGLMDTIIVDDEGIYDVRQPNDRLLLGLKGTLSEAELSWFRQRAQAGLLSKARRGELILGLPVGYIKGADGRIDKHPDRRVQEAIAVVFRKFVECGSARQVLLWLRQNGILLPAVSIAEGRKLIWRLPVYQTIIKFLKNPIYAGAYAFGRTATHTRVLEGRAHKVRGYRRAREQWSVLLPDHHEGYIGWEDYERNQRLLADNAQMKGLMVRGAARRGPSLLAGLLRCGRCGRKLHVAYSGTRGQVPRYHCRGGALNHGTDFCISFGGLRVDEAISREVVAVLAPGAIEAALKTATDVASKHDELARAIELELEQAEYEAERARRQFDAVEPENRLVAATLESRWDAALRSANELRTRLEALCAEHRPQLPDRAALLQLARQFDKVWNHPAADHRIRKRLVRLLIEEIVATVDEAEPSIELVVHWKGGKHTALKIIKNRTGQHHRSTNHEAVEVVRELAPRLPDGQIARILNRLGYQTGAGNGFTAHRVVSLRNYHGIAVYNSDAAPSSITIEKASERLGVSTATVRRMIAVGIIEARQPVPYAPWAIDPAILSNETVKRAVDAIRSVGKLPRTAPASQLSLIKSST
jgi:DNA invertase Pin-like site-specific DNA recombinase